MKKNETPAKIIAERMKRAAKLKTYGELGDLLGSITSQAISSAIARNKIPETWFDIIHEKTGATREELTRPPQNVVANLEIDLSLPPEQHEKNHSQSDMLIMTARVLESQTVYRSALASNIRAFYQAVQDEEEMGKLSDQITQVQRELAEMKQRLESIERPTEKKRAGNHD